MFALGPMIRRNWCLATLVATLVLTYAHAAAQSPASLQGTITDSGGAPLPGVTVALGASGERVTRTSATGSFDFPGLSDGTYELRAALPGWTPLQQTIRLAAGERRSLALTLLPAILEQVLVSGTKAGEQDAQTTPVAVTVISDRELQQLQARRIDDVAGWVPSVNFSQHTGFAQLSIRGIGSTAVFAGSDPSSAVYVDGVYLARPAMVLADFLDLERIEVLRGPQGTLYGRNSVGGAFNIVTRQPTNDPDAMGRVVLGSDRTFRVEARAGGPLVKDRVLANVSFLRGLDRGFVRDLNHPDDRLGGEDVTAMRAKVRFVVNRANEVLLSADGTHNDARPLFYAKALAVKPGFVVDNPADSHDVRASTAARGRNLQYGGSVRWTSQLAIGTLTSLTAYRRVDYDVTIDSDSTELQLAATRVHELQHQWSQELTISRRRERQSWIGGVFLFGETDHQPSFITLPAAGVENRGFPNVDSESAAAFGETTLQLTTRLSATAGLRYSREHKSIDNSGGMYPLIVPTVPQPGSSYAYADAISSDAWTPKAGVEFRPTRRTLAYGSVARGFKSGGFNPSSTERGRGYGPEWAWSYEGGIKSEIASLRSRLTAAVFYMDYNDLQVQTTLRPGVLDVSNAAAATVRGLELEAVSQVGPDVRAGGHVAWLDARYDRYLAVAPGGVTADVAGHRLNNAPEWSGRVWVEWTRRIAGSRTLTIRPDAVWHSTAYFTPFNDLIQRQGSYGLLNVTAGIQPQRGCCEIAMYARNLTDLAYITGTLASPPPVIGARPGASRQIGVELIFRRWRP